MLKLTTISKLIGISLIASVGSANATMIDLADTANPSGSFTTNLGTVTFTWDQLQPAGTGVLDPFVRIQKSGSEQGYNTTQDNAGDLPFEEKFGLFTHDVTIASLVDHDGDGSYEFVLDIGEPVNKTQSLLSLDGLKLFSTSAPGQNGNTVDSNGNWTGPSDSTLLWDMDSDIDGIFSDNYVLLDANRNGKPGNGVSDMLMDVDVSILDSAPSDEMYFVLWSRFGLSAESGAESFGTFEEWSQVKSTTPAPVPEPASAFMIGLGLAGLAGFRKRNQRRK
jgi:hypothetical protein